MNKTNARDIAADRTLLAALVAVALPGAVACQSSPPPAVTERTVTAVFRQSPKAAFDILFVVDNTPAAAGLQTKLAAAFPQFMNILKGLPGGLPDLHVAVVSSNMGAGPSATPGCPVGGDRGAFQTAPRLAGCSTGLPPGQTYLSAVAGVNNFTGDISDAFACIAALGADGCQFPHPFAATLAALEPGSGQPPGNAGFLRPSAYLLVVLVSSEDDCSAPPGTSLFDSTSLLVSDPLGPLASYRCNEFGHLCGGQKPPRTPAVLMDCTSAEDGRLLHVSQVVERLAALKNGDKVRVMAAAISGPSTPYEVITVPRTPAADAPTEDEPQIKPSCNSGDVHGDPAVRIKQWVDAFRGTFVSVCDSDLVPVLRQVAEGGGPALHAPCIPGKLVDRDPSTDGVQPDCVVTKVLIDALDRRTETVVPSCAASPTAAPCWTIAVSPVCLGSSDKTLSLLTLQNDPPTTSAENIAISCGVCLPADSNPGCQY